MVNAKIWGNNAFLVSLASGSIIPPKFDFGNQRKIQEIKEK